jgi:protein TonB
VPLKGSPQTEPATSDWDYSPPDHTAACLKNPELLYPAAARERSMEGSVLLEVLVSAGGNPLIMKIKKSSGHPILDTAALWSMEQWRFEPARRNGRAVEALVEVPIHFGRANPPE